VSGKPQPPSGAGARGEDQWTDRARWYAGTTITEPPTIAGRYGRAWQVRLPPVGQRGAPQFDGTLDAYLLHRPGAHAFWDHWLVSVVHLRPIDGVPPAVLQAPTSTHELLIAALDPQTALPTLDVTDLTTWRPHLLRPFDVMEQFSAANDAIAADVFDVAIRTIVEHGASPDQDWRGWWRSMIAETAATLAGADRRPS
jgi:hypothetical protein